MAAGSTSISGVGTGVAYPRFDTSSCKTGFRNIPKSPDASQNNGVTFVLFNKASVCFNQNCTSPGGSTPTVLLSPFCSTFRPGLPVTPPDQVLAQPAGIAAGTPCTPPYANAGAYMNDGAFIVYSTSQGIVQDQGINSRIGLAGTLYMPSMSLQIQQNAVFELVPGQIIAHDLNIQTGNKQNPSVYYPCCKANNSTAAPVLVGGQLPPVLHLIR